MLTMEEKSTLTKEDFIKYLKIYTGDIDWEPHLMALKKNIDKHVFSDDQAERDRRNQAACAILLPGYDKSKLTTPPENLLFWCGKYDIFTSRNWYEKLQEVVAEDHKIQQVRNQALDLGIVYPLHYNPRWRQAYNWLMDRVNSDDSVVDMDTTKKMFENLVFSYGGAVICNVFNKPEFTKTINSLPNWRTGYFFERIIHRAYKADEILKIKAQDIEEIRRSDQKLIKKVSK